MGEITMGRTGGETDHTTSHMPEDLKGANGYIYISKGYASCRRPLDVDSGLLTSSGCIAWELNNTGVWLQMKAFGCF